jgi:hypothetical protein
LKKQGSGKQEVAMFIENKRLKQDNAILRGSLEQLKETLRLKEQAHRRSAHLHA